MERKALASSFWNGLAFFWRMHLASSSREGQVMSLLVRQVMSLLVRQVMRRVERPRVVAVASRIYFVFSYLHSGMAPTN